MKPPEKNTHLSLRLVGLVTLVVSGCAPAMKSITYDMTSVERSRSVAPAQVLNVRILRDGRRQDPANSILFKGSQETEFQGKTVCVNSEYHYVAGTVPRQISSLIARHLQKKGMFKTVVFGANDWADYQLVGTLSAFYVRQEFDYGAAVGASFGMIGAIATANNSNPTEVRIAITRLELYDRLGNLVGRPNDIFVHINGPEPSDAYCWKVYDVATRHLEAAIERLAQAVEQTVSSQRGGW